MELKKNDNWQRTYPNYMDATDWLDGKDIAHDGYDMELRQHRRRIISAAVAHWKSVMPQIEYVDIVAATPKYNSNGKFIFRTARQDYILDPA